MALIEIKRDPTPREVRQFALLALPAFCLLLAGLGLFRYASWPAALLLTGAAIASAVLGLLRPRWMRAVLIAWMWAAWPIGWVVSHLLMAIIYYLVIAPIGLIMRALGRDPLQRRLDRDAATYWTPREPEIDSDRYFRQF
jgi:hypothetical protein